VDGRARNQENGEREDGEVARRVHGAIIKRNNIVGTVAFIGAVHRSSIIDCRVRLALDLAFFAILLLLLDVSFASTEIECQIESLVVMGSIFFVIVLLSSVITNDGYRAGSNQQAPGYKIGYRSKFRGEGGVFILVVGRLPLSYDCPAIFPRQFPTHGINQLALSLDRNGAVGCDPNGQRTVVFSFER
jgi:hypothetical protein